MQYYGTTEEHNRYTRFNHTGRRNNLIMKNTHGYFIYNNTGVFRTEFFEEFAVRNFLLGIKYNTRTLVE
jgi:hypothetical protein